MLDSAMSQKPVLICVFSLLCITAIYVARSNLIDMGILTNNSLSLFAQILLCFNVILWLPKYLRSYRNLSMLNVIVLIGMFAWECVQPWLAYKYYDPLDLVASAVGFLINQMILHSISD